MAKPRSYCLVCFALLWVLTTSTLPTLARCENPKSIQSLLRLAIPGTRDLQLIIELTDPPVVEAMRKKGRDGPANLDTPQAVAYRAKLARAQHILMDRLRGLKGVRIERSTDLVLNAIIARAPVEQYAEICGLPGVKTIHISRPRQMS